MPKIFGSAGALPSRKPLAIRYSPLAAVSPFATRHSLLAAVSARQEPRPPNSFRPSSRVPRPVLSWWLQKRSLLKQARKTGGRISRCAENFRQCGSTALQKTHPPVANRKSPVAAVSARQEPRPPNSSVFGWAGAQPSKLLFAIRYSPSLRFRPCKLLLDGLFLCRQRWRKEERDHAG